MFYNNNTAKYRVQDINLNHIKLKVNDTYKWDVKRTTNCETFPNEDVINKIYLDTKLSKKRGDLSTVEKDYNGIELHNDKQCEEILIGWAVKTIIQNFMTRDYLMILILLLKY